jgi:hypothetical protein
MTSTPQAIATWLASNKCKCFDVQPCVVTINGESWQACQYSQTLEYTAGMDCVTRGEKQAGDTYTRTGFYCVGSLPSCYRGSKRNKYPQGRACFPFEGLDWYVVCYIERISPQFQDSHPFGPNFLLAPWDVPTSKIDQYETKPYSRFTLVVTPAVPKGWSEIESGQEVSPA